MRRFQERFGPVRAAVYIDGFNLYHRIHEARAHHVKWQDLWRLSARIICKRHNTSLVKVGFYTAVPDAPQDVKERHLTYNRALKRVGVDVVNGHHVVDPDSGKRTEKQTDINMALHLIRDAHDGVYDCAYIVSADSDQAATAKMLKDWFPKKFLIGVAPPQSSVPDKVKTYADTHFSLSMGDLERCIFDDPLIGSSGKPIPRPTSYNPPRGWVRPI